SGGGKEKMHASVYLSCIQDEAHLTPGKSGEDHAGQGSKDEVGVDAGVLDQPLQPLDGACDVDAQGKSGSDVRELGAAYRKQTKGEKAQVLTLRLGSVKQGADKTPKAIIRLAEGKHLTPHS